nr:unnamed protein product [Spirometra erinaceieuropaei]
MVAEQRCVGSPCDEDVSGLQLQDLPLTTDNGTILHGVSTASYRPYVPISLHRNVFSALHNLSHLRIRTTDKLVSEHFIWPRMYKDLKAWTQRVSAVSGVRSNGATRLSSASSLLRIHGSVMPTYTSWAPMPPSSGCSHLFTCVDRFARWPEAIPLPDVAAPTVVKAFRSPWVAIFGSPSTMPTDRGTRPLTPYPSAPYTPLPSSSTSSSSSSSSSSSTFATPNCHFFINLQHSSSSKLKFFSCAPAEPRLDDVDAKIHPASADHSTARAGARTDTLTWFSPPVETVAWGVAAEQSPATWSHRIDPAEMVAEQCCIGSPCDEDVSGLQLQDLPLTTDNGTILRGVSTASYRPYVPISLHPNVFSALHNLSHLRSRATDKLVSDHFIWPRMYKDLEAWTQRVSAVSELDAYRVERPWIRIACRIDDRLLKGWCM